MIKSLISITFDGETIAYELEAEECWSRLEISLLL